MIFNLVSNLKETAKLEELHSYNHVIAWQLRIALQSVGHEVHFIQDHHPQPITCDHTIVISNVAMTKIRESQDYRKQLTDVTEDKFCLWLDSDLGDWPMFNRVLCVNLCHPKRTKNSERFRYVGWATNPIMFYPSQTRPAVFVDPYMYGWYGGTADHIYDVTKKVIGKFRGTVFQPVEMYNHGRVPWLTMATMLSQSSYFVATQITNWGLVNLEAAAAGALLVLHEQLDRPETWPSKLNYVTWKTEEELTEILKRPVNVEANRKIALQNTWNKVVENIMEALK